MEWAKERRYEKWVEMDKARPPMGLDGKSSQKTGAEQAEKIWKLAHPVENLDNRNKNTSTVPC